MKVFERQILNFVDAFDLANEQFRVAYDFQRFVAMLDGVFERRDQSLILGEVVGLVAKIFAQRRDFLSSLVLNNNAVSRRAGIATCATVAVGSQVILGRTTSTRGK